MQLQKIFYEKLGYPVVKKTATGQPSTAEPILQELADERGFADYLLLTDDIAEIPAFLKSHPPAS